MKANKSSLMIEQICACGQIGGYSIRNANPQGSIEPPVLVIRHEPPRYQEIQDPLTLQMTGKLKMVYPGGRHCGECAKAELKRLKAEAKTTQRA